MLPEPCYQMAGCLPDIARLAAWTCDFIDNMALEHAGNRGFKIGNSALTLEALFISELKPKLNTKDEYRSI